MPRGLGRLPFLKRRSTASDEPASQAPAAAGPRDPDAAPIGPPVLLPASIIRQLLFDASELTPVWARPRPDPQPEPIAVASAAAVPAEPTPKKRSRRASTGVVAKPARTEPTPRRSRRASGSPKADG